MRIFKILKYLFLKHQSIILLIYSYFLSHNWLPCQRRIFTKAVSTWCVCFSEGENILHSNSFIFLNSEVAVTPKTLYTCEVTIFSLKIGLQSFLGSLVVKNPLAKLEIWSITRLGRGPGEGNCNPLQYFCLGSPMDRRAWWALVHEVAELHTT